MNFELSKFNNKMLRAFCAFLSAMVIVTQGSGFRLNSTATKGINLTGAKNSIFSTFSHCFYDATQKIPRDAPIAKTSKYQINGCSLAL